MKILYTDAGYTWQNTAKTEEGKLIMGRICVADGEEFTRVEMVGVGKVPKLKQYINVFELIAIARAMEIAIEKGWTGSLAIYSDSRVAVGWASTLNIKDKKAETEAHKSALEYVRTARKNYVGIVTYNFINREKNPAGHVLEKELEKDKEARHQKVEEEKNEPINRAGIAVSVDCECGCHTSIHSDEEMKLKGCDICAPLHL